MLTSEHIRTCFRDGETEKHMECLLNEEEGRSFADQPCWDDSDDFTGLLGEK